MAALLHATELLESAGSPFPTYELFFTVSEETGLVGAKHLGEVLASPLAAVFDSSGRWGASRRGRPASRACGPPSAGGRPTPGWSRREDGAPSCRREGHRRHGVWAGWTRRPAPTSASSEGEWPPTSSPSYCEIQGECRSHDEEKLAQVAAAMVDAIQEGAAEVGVDVDISLVHEYRAFALTGRSPVVRLSKAAISALGIEPRVRTAGGGSDANILNARGLPTVNLDAGMMRVHTADEYVTLDDLERLCSLVLQLVVMAPEYGPQGADARVGGR